VSTCSVPPPSKEDLSTREVTLYSLLGLFFVTAIGTGATIYDNHPVVGGIAAFVGTVGLAVAVILLIRFRPKTIHALIVTTAALLSTLAFLAYILWTRPKEIIVHDPPTAEDIEKAIAPTKTELNAKTQELTTVTADRDAEKQRADKLDVEVAAVKKEADEARKANSDPIKVTLLPTNLRIQFNSIDGVPAEINVANIHWTTIIYTKKMSLYCPDPRFPTICAIVYPQGDKNDFDQTVIRLTIFFDRPIVYKTVQTNVFGAKVGAAIASQSNRMAIVQLTPDKAVTSFAFDVKPSP
jgi:hypothetical protein